MKDKIWNKEKHWFTFKFSLIFLILGIIFYILAILSSVLWFNVVLLVIFIILANLFIAIFIAPILKYFHV